MTGTVTVDDLPLVPVDSPEFWADPERFLGPARAVHPWVARFADGLLVHGLKANADLYAEDETLWMGLDGLVDFYGAAGTPWADFMHGMINSQRGAEHARIRGSMAAAFTPRAANRLRPVIRNIINRQLDQWLPAGAFDFAEFAANYPIAVICALLGTSAEPVPRLRQSLEAQLASIAMDRSVLPQILGGFGIMAEFADGIVREREASGPAGQDDLLDALIVARDAGQLNDTEVRYLIMVLMYGGYDTSKNMLTMTMHLLLDRPELYAGCAESVEAARAVINEALRHSSIATPVRQVQQAFTYDGFAFPEGAIVYLSAPMAGRDPAFYDDPLRFDPDRRDEARHVAFGRGPHMCVGQYLARTVLEEGLHAIASRLKHPRRAGPSEWRPLLGAWGLKTLPIAFESA